MQSGRSRVVATGGGARSATYGIAQAQEVCGRGFSRDYGSDPSPLKRLPQGFRLEKLTIHRRQLGPTQQQHR